MRRGKGRKKSLMLTARIWRKKGGREEGPSPQNALNARPEGNS